MNKKRVYLIARYTQVLKDPKQKDRSNEAFQKNESVRLATSVKNKDYQEASVILDIGEQKVLKNRFSERSFEDLFKYYALHYGDYMNRWFNAHNSRV